MQFGFLAGGGDAGSAIASYDWSKTSLGPISAWPDALRISVGMMVNSRFPKSIIWGEDYTTLFNDAFRPILGSRAHMLGQSFRNIWADVWTDIEPFVRQAFAGEAVFLEDLHLVTSRSGVPADAWFTFCYSPIRSADGDVLGIIDTVIETTGKVLADRNSRLLNVELSHRMKNTLAMIGAVANQTFRTATSIEKARDAFNERLAALGEAHNLLTQLSWTQAPIDQVAEGALRPHRTGQSRIRVNGPHALLSSRQALSMALAIHELATNAAKYGSLSTAEGHVELSWAVEGAALTFVWEERGGPPITPAGGTGFGSTLLRRILPQHFHGSATMKYELSGFVYELQGDLDPLEVNLAR